LEKIQIENLFIFEIWMNFEISITLEFEQISKYGLIFWILNEFNVLNEFWNLNDFRIFEQILNYLNVKQILNFEQFLNFEKI
jgi:hypothetical protein